MKKNKKILFFPIIILAVFVLAKFSPMAQAAEGSQCQTGQDFGEQTGCTHDNDSTILKNQCAADYSSSASSTCSSMQAYLNAMASDCADRKPANIDCNMIAQNGYYGKNASEFAQYMENNPDNKVVAPASNTTSANGEIAFPDSFNLPDPPGGIVQIISTFLSWLLGIIGIIAMIAFIISGLQYFYAAGDDKTMQDAKRNMTYSIIGVIVALAGYVIIQAIDSVLNANTLF